MAMTPQAQNHTTRSITLSDSLVEIYYAIQRNQAEYNNNSIASELTDGNLEAINDFKHLTGAEAIAIQTAFSAFMTAMGDEVTGQITNLIKARG